MMTTFRLFIVLVISEIADAKLKIGYHYPSFEYDNGVEEQKVRDVIRLPPPTALSRNAIWVFDFKDIFNDVKLRLASSSEVEDVDDMFESMLARLNSRLKRDEPLPASCKSRENLNGVIYKYYTATKIKREIMKVINKFVSSSLSDPDTYLTELNNSGPSLALYFKRPFSMLVVRSGRRQWHYIISPPSSLPCWFYEENFDVLKNGTDRFVEIPASVSENMYISLLPMITKFLSFPV